ncbi:MAG: glycosyltransferase family 4 protein [Bdellovibrionales bacterium]|jgi:glycosyltransferase involved in cell wall biosynthesis|nr:glycosyltransferase family 4 protein [Bdellovibrionales bacterium]
MTDDKTPQLKILHVYQSASFSGAEAYAMEVALHHARIHDVTFLAFKDSSLSERLAHIVSSSRHAQAGNSESQPHFKGRLDVQTDASQVCFESFDAVILHSTQELKSHWTKIAKAKLKSKLGLTAKAPKIIVYTHIWISHSKKDPLHALTYSVVDRLWCSSERSKKELERYIPISPKKIQVVRYGRDTAHFVQNLLSRDEARRKLKLPQDAIVIGTIARVDQGKGSGELLHAALELMATEKKLHLLMIGPATASDPKAVAFDKELDGTIASLATNAPDIHSRVHKLGRLEGGSFYLPVFDLFVLATYKENFALTLLEALLAGAPCLATNSGGSPDVVQPEKTGWLFQPASQKALKEALILALSEKEKWPFFSKNGRDLVVENYDFHAVMQDMEHKLTQVLREQP